MNESTTYHIPVLLKESVDALVGNNEGTYVDTTFGGGGHSREILSRLGGNGRLFSFDQDADAEENALKKREDGICLSTDPRWTFIRSNLRH